MSCCLFLLFWNIALFGQSDTGELRITVTHTGVFTTPMGDLPPTGKSVVLDACDVVRFDGDGKVVSWHAYFDSASMMAQLGAVAA